jgi:hypothetical protein
MTLLMQHATSISRLRVCVHGNVGIHRNQGNVLELTGKIIMKQWESKLTSSDTQLFLVEGSFHPLVFFVSSNQVPE